MIIVAECKYVQPLQKCQTHVAMPVCLSISFLFVTVHPKKVRHSDEGSSTPSVPPGAQKITTLWQRIRHCLKQGLNYFNKTRACFYFDLTRSYCVCIHFF